MPIWKKKSECLFWDWNKNVSATENDGEPNHTDNYCHQGLVILPAWYPVVLLGSDGDDWEKSHTHSRQNGLQSQQYKLDVGSCFGAAEPNTTNRHVCFTKGQNSWEDQKSWMTTGTLVSARKLEDHRVEVEGGSGHICWVKSVIKSWECVSLRRGGWVAALLRAAACQKTSDLIYYISELDFLRQISKDHHESVNAVDIQINYLFKSIQRTLS